MPCLWMKGIERHVALVFPCPQCSRARIPLPHSGLNNKPLLSSSGYLWFLRQHGRCSEERALNRAGPNLNDRFLT